MNKTKLQFLGTGSYGSKDRALTSFLINDELLFDIGSGTIRQMQIYDVDISKIKYLIVTHYHLDHFADISCLIMKRKIIDGNKNKLTIIGPKNIEVETFKMMDKYFNDINKEWNKEITNIEFIEMENDNVIIDNYEITAYKTIHGNCEPVNSYKINTNQNDLGFSGDSGVCEAQDNLVDKSNTLFLDSTKIGKSDVAHLNYGAVLDYAEKFPKKMFYAIHRGDYEINNKPDNLFMPNDSEIVEL